jgi:hypothetical protein
MGYPVAAWFTLVVNHKVKEIIGAHPQSPVGCHDLTYTGHHPGPNTTVLICHDQPTIGLFHLRGLPGF